MIKIDNVLVSEDFLDEFFCCDLNSCKGACCIEGDAGAPLKEEEIAPIREKFSQVKPFLSERSIEEIEKTSGVAKDRDGEWVTATVENRECVFAFYDEKGILKCSFEKAWDGSEKDFRKPISCHLYPAREVNLFGATALNYHQWEICSPACELGKREKIPLYKFLREGLEKRFGAAWYGKFSEIMEAIKKKSLPESGSDRD